MTVPMGDLVECKCVLRKVAPEGADRLYLAVPPDLHLRIIPCRPKGTPKRGNGAEWEYEEKDGRLHLTPSLRCLDTGFHTDYNWHCAYEVCAEGDGYDRFYEFNPELKPK